MSKWMIVVLLAAVTALGVAGITYRSQMKQPRIVTVDLVSLINDARQRLHDPERIKQFTMHLEQRLIRLSRDEHLVILSSRAVATGAPDITPRLRRRLLP